MRHMVWPYVIRCLFVLAVSATVVDCFIHPIGIAGYAIWLLAFAAYLLSEKVENRHLRASEKAFAYSISCLFGFLVLSRLGKEVWFNDRNALIMLPYALFTAAFLVWLASRLHRQATDTIGVIKVWTYTTFFGGTMVVVALRILWRACRG